MLRRLIVLLSVAVTAGAGSAQPYQLSTLGSFTTASGFGSYGGLVQDAAGNLYGASSGGGASGVGTVFTVVAGSGTVSAVASFAGGNGAVSYGGLVADPSGNLYGTTDRGGTNNTGTVFRVNPATGILTTLASFTPATGANPTGTLVRDGAGHLYGTTAAGGTGGGGTLFRVDGGTAALTAVVTFSAATGAYPRAGLTPGGGSLYGTTAGGGANGGGTVFRFDPAAGTVTPLASFGPNQFGPNQPSGLARDGAGNLYGTNFDGPASSRGRVFKLDAATGTLSTLASFGSGDGLPYGAPVVDAAGNLYGTTAGGGANGRGRVFKVAAGSNTLTTLYSFTGGADGADPYSDLTLGADGVTLYGTTFFGGAAGNGTVFALTPVPEPATVGLVAAGLLVVVRKMTSPRRSGTAGG